MLLAGKDARDQQELGESPGQTLPRGRRRSQSAGTLTLDSRPVPTDASPERYVRPRGAKMDAACFLPGDSERTDPCCLSRSVRGTLLHWPQDTHSFPAGHLLFNAVTKLLVKASDLVLVIWKNMFWGSK